MLCRTRLYFILLVIVGITNIFFFFFGLSCRMSLFCSRYPHLKHAGVPSPGCDSRLSYLIILPGPTSKKKKRQCIVNRLTGAEVKHVASAARRSFYYHKCQRSSSSLARFFFFITAAEMSNAFATVTTRRRPGRLGEGAPSHRT